MSDKASRALEQLQKIEKQLPDVAEKLIGQMVVIQDESSRHYGTYGNINEININTMTCRIRVALKNDRQSAWFETHEIRVSNASNDSEGF